ncbi:LacI family DNA-binding transcriptional regulator [Roseibium sp.]|uniref:LacI family DNA-binding transcriptional regulator n=1 Tax=Roseibium sp. TaxID=1936156 RepID=UPI003D12C952
MTAKQRLSDRKSKVTVRDIALRAKVSESTVSRILRNKGPIAEDTRDKVMEVVRTMGYVPNRIAGSLASLSSNLVGVIVPSLSNIVFTEVLQGINAGLETTGDMQAVISISEYDVAQEEHVIRNLLSWKPAAVLTTGFEHSDATRRMLELSDVRVVEMMEIDSDPIDIAVGMSHSSAGYETGRHLIAKGWRRFGYVGHNLDRDRRARLRYDGLRKALSEAGLEIAVQAVAGSASSVGAGKQMTAQLLTGGIPVDGIVYSNDDMAIGGVFHCQSAGLSTPEDIGIFGFNGLDIGNQMPKPLSTIRSNRFLIGKTAIEAMLNEPEGTKIDTGFEIFEGETA